MQRAEHRGDVGARCAGLVGDGVQRTLQFFRAAELFHRLRHRILPAERRDARPDHVGGGLQQHACFVISVRGHHQGLAVGKHKLQSMVG